MKGEGREIWCVRQRHGKDRKRRRVGGGNEREKGRDEHRLRASVAQFILAMSVGKASCPV